MKKTITVRLMLVACASAYPGFSQEQRPAQEFVAVGSFLNETADCLARAELNLSVNPQQIRLGESGTISWDVTISDACGLVRIEVDGQVVQDSGTKTISPALSRNVTLTVSQNISGKWQTRTRTAAIDVVQTPVPCIGLDNGNQLTAADVQLFDERWMKPEDRAGRLGGWASGLKDRQGWNVWGVGDEAIAMVRMYELTHGRMLEPTNGRKYLDDLRDINEQVLRFRNDQHPGDDFPNGDNPRCVHCQPPAEGRVQGFVDRERGALAAGWSSATHWDWVNDGGLDPVDAVTSGLYAYGLAAFARIVSEDPSLQTQYGPDAARYGPDAVKYANEALKTMWTFMSGFNSWLAWNVVPEGTFMRPAVFPTTEQCQQAHDFSYEHALEFAGVNGAKPDDVLRLIDNALSQSCLRAGSYAGKPEAHNQSGMLISMMIELWRALDSDFYRSAETRSGDSELAHGVIPLVVVLHQRFFADNLHIRSSSRGENYWWNYNDGVPDPHIEDGHSHLDMFNLDVLRRGFLRLNAAVAGTGEAIALDDAMLQRFANTFLDEIARPDEIDGGGDFRFDVNGRSNLDVNLPSDASNSFCDGWVYLASVNPEIYRLCRQVTLRIKPPDPAHLPVCTLQGSSDPHSQPYLTINNHAALLSAKQFAPAMVTVPNVLGMQQNEAIAAMKSTGLLPGQMTRDDRCIDVGGTVLLQNPSAGPQSISPGETFELTISSGRDRSGKPCTLK